MEAAPSASPASKNSEGLTSSQRHSFSNVPRSGCLPFSTRDSGRGTDPDLTGGFSYPPCSPPLPNQSTNLRQAHFGHEHLLSELSTDRLQFDIQPRTGAKLVTIKTKSYECNTHVVGKELEDDCRRQDYPEGGDARRCV